MPHVEVEVPVRGRSAPRMYAVVAAFERYPQLTDAVRNVTVTAAPDRVLSTWEVRFRNGILCWSEEDRLDPEARTIRFTQIDGDLEHFSGVWEVLDEAGGCRVCFRADFDLGIPSLAAILDPIAARALRENIVKIVSGLAEAESEHPA